MTNLLTRWLIVTLVILATPYVVTGVNVDSFGAALLAAFVLGVLNLFLKPILILLTLPFTIVTFGLFLIAINAALFMMASSMVSGFHVDSFWSACLASLLVSLVSAILNRAGSGSHSRVAFRISRDEVGRRKVRDVEEIR